MCNCSCLGGELHKLQPTFNIWQLQLINVEMALSADQTRQLCCNAKPVDNHNQKQSQKYFIDPRGEIATAIVTAAPIQKS